MLGHMSRMAPPADAYKAIYQIIPIQTGEDDLVDLDSAGWLPFNDVCGNLTLN